jgi:molybdopterin molybdotransferase
MQSVDSYLAEIAASVHPLPPRDLSLTEAEGGVLAADMLATGPLPPFDNSAMDGYAVRAADVAGATPGAPVTLPVAGEIAAGDTRGHWLAAGTCLRIMTGAALPPGADAVVQVELTDGGTEQVAIREAVIVGSSVRRAGGDVTPGDLLLAAGATLGPVELGLLAAAGHGSVLARPRPRVAVISTGNELAEPGMPLARGQIWESNGVMLAAAARAAGGVAYRPPIVPDDTAKVLAAVEGELEHADLLLTSGGVSMGGEHDVVKAALQTLGTVAFRKIAMQPGMPQGFGLLGAGRTPILTLPGNPVSAYVSFHIFGRAVLRALQGATAPGPWRTRARLTHPLRSPAGKRSFLRGVLLPGGTQVTPLSGQASHQLATLARANVLIIVREPVTVMNEGDVADVMFLHD